VIRLAAWRGQGSLTFRLLRGLVIPLALLGLLLGVGGALVIAESVETVNDRILGAASRAIADSLTVEDGQVTLDLSPAIFGMLEDNERDNVYYSVRRRGATLTGYGDLPDIAARGLADTQVVFGMARYHDRDIRVVAEGRRVPGVAEPLVVEVAETMDQRRRTSRRMLEGLVALELMLIGALAVLMPLAVRWGLRPVRQVGQEMDRRSGSDLTPLPTAQVPVELRDLVRAFNGMLTRLDATLQGMRRFTADASHQMRTPLSILRTHIALLRKAEPGSDEARISIDDIDLASARLQNLLVQLLALARADNATTSPVPLEPVDLNRVAEDIAADCAPRAIDAGVDLQFQGARHPMIVATQPSLLGELVGNLIDNAIRYGRPAGVIVMALEASPRHHRIVIEDDGPGIAPDDRERVFTRFTRLTRDETKTGSGLGLPIARMLAEAIGAALTLATAGNGHGLRAEITFARLTDS
jgi:two-component system, OmpR family, sensor histidine kinase TctE